VPQQLATPPSDCWQSEPTSTLAQLVTAVSQLPYRQTIPVWQKL
jgi:hypothetical protein